MLKKHYLLTLLTILFASVTFAQNQGTIQGVVKDKETGELLPFVTLVIEQDGAQKGSATTDFDGKYKFSSVTPGSYDVKAVYMGYQPALIKGVLVKGGKIRFLDVNLGAAGDVQLEEFIVTEFTVPLIDKDAGASGTTITKEEIAKLPTRSAEGIAAQSAGVSSTGDGLSIRGARASETYYYIDGIKVRGSTSLPKSAIEEVSVITGGIPANIGDATGGIISITTRGPSSFYYGGVEVLTSGFRTKNGDLYNDGKSGYGDKTFGLDKYAYNLFEASLSGPLLMKKDSSGKKTTPLLGFFISSNYTTAADGRPLAFDSYRVKEDVRNDLIQNPLGQLSSGGTFYRAEALTEGSFEEVDFRQNAQYGVWTGAAKLDVVVAKRSNLTFGGSFSRSNGSLYNTYNSLLNFNNFGEYTNNSWRVYGKFTQRFGKQGEEAQGAWLKDGFFTIMADYSKTDNYTYNARHKDNIFNYGYVGKFELEKERTFEPSENDPFFLIQNAVEKDVKVTFTPSDVNSDLAALTNQYFSLYDDVAGNYENLLQVQSGNALRNGDSPKSVYNLWGNVGSQYNGNQHVDNNQFRVTANASASIGDHTITIGGEFEQRNDRVYGSNPYSLWTVMRQYANNHIKELDENNYTDIQRGSFIYREYERLNAAPGEFSASDNQYFFDYNLRKSMGLNPDGTDFINIDAIDPNSLSLDFFSAGELVTPNEGYVYYRGYDYKGNKQKGGNSISDFFNATDEYGNNTRPVNPYQPIYASGYIMDKFAFQDLIFNVGVRVDRFDANQPVLKDPFLVGNAKTAGEVNRLFDTDGNLNKEISHPSNIDSDYVVYVDNKEQPTAVTGYRNGRVWYNANGAEISDPTSIKSQGSIQPYLQDANNQGVDEGSFKDYDAQINIMPRVSFSFPISDEALFFAHYDILTSRPGNNIFNPYAYLYINDAYSNFTFTNPNLKPTKTIDYELGFQQVLTKSSSIKISAFYRDLQDMVQATSFVEAYPRTYTSYGNVDFGTVKGFSFSYDMRRTGNIQMKLAYTLQFANGTGSGPNSALRLVNSGKPNLRTIFPFDYDSPHNVTLSIDYRYGSGRDYNGPVLFGQDVLKNTGINLVCNLNAGTPYSAYKLATSTATGDYSAPLDGQINGSRLPWQTYINAQIDKDIPLQINKDENGKGKKLNLNVYFQINNLLNIINTVGVYPYTGNADDDGYLTDPRFQTLISSQTNEEAFRDQYSIKANTPYNYSSPRTIRLGVKCDF